jgi:dynein heavy chain
LQVHARKYDLPIDELSFEFHVLNIYREQAEINEASKHLEFGQELEADKNVIVVYFNLEIILNFIFKRKRSR